MRKLITALALVAALTGCAKRQAPPMLAGETPAAYTARMEYLAAQAEVDRMAYANALQGMSRAMDPLTRPVVAPAPPAFPVTTRCTPVGGSVRCTSY